ncbi:MAG TPA: RodZ domain-containing protein [Bryobacteraceae bacterium]|jgi:cytoskeleton protein RodZ|nr:RodZ domain-containing protein [Bryobacteraceae bacterium]
MTSLGDTLRREREKRNLDLEQVSRELKIAPRFLEAIEEERYERLPGGVFAKSFVRQYARLLDIDEEEAATEVQRNLAPTPDPQLSQLASHGSSAPVAFAPRVGSIETRNFGSGSWLSALALVVAVMLGCSLVYGWWQRERHPVSAASPAPAAQIPVEAANAQPPQAPLVADATPSANPPQQQADEVTPPIDSASRSAEAPAPSDASQTALRPEGAVKVEIKTSNEPVWVLARTDGKYAFSGTLEPNQTRTVDADGIVLLRLGNAGGVAITVNGKQIPSVGPRGQVRTVQLTSGGFQIVAPPKPVSPDGLL